MNKDPHRYDDIIHLPHHQSEVHPHMELSDRAAQFSPFAALTGYDDAVRETARLTSEKIELDEHVRELLDRRLQILKEHLQECPVISFSYFVPDSLKEGGSYLTTVGTVKNIDLYSRQIILYSEDGMSPGPQINLDDISAIDGDLFRNMEDYGKIRSST